MVLAMLCATGLPLRSAQTTVYEQQASVSRRYTRLLSRRGWQQKRGSETSELS
jgi:hypothetical protein